MKDELARYQSATLQGGLHWQEQPQNPTAKKQSANDHEINQRMSAFEKRKKDRISYDDRENP